MGVKQSDASGQGRSIVAFLHSLALFGATAHFSESSGEQGRVMG